MIITMITLKKRSFTEPLGMISVECQADTDGALATALSALETVEFCGWIYTVHSRCPEQRLLVVENYPIGERISGEIVQI